MPAAKQPACFEGGAFFVDLRRPHRLILNSEAGILRTLIGEF